MSSDRWRRIDDYDGKKYLSFHGIRIWRAFRVASGADSFKQRYDFQHNERGTRQKVFIPVAIFARPPQRSWLRALACFLSFSLVFYIYFFFLSCALVSLIRTLIKWGIMCCTYDAPLSRGWTFHHHVCGVINTRCNAADSLVVLSAFVTSNTVRDTCNRINNTFNRRLKSDARGAYCKNNSPDRVRSRTWSNLQIVGSKNPFFSPLPCSCTILYSLHRK